MPIATQSNHYKYQLGKGNIDLSADTLTIILMGDEFIFDKDTHATLASITEDSWAATTAYSADDIVIPTTPNGHKYKCTTGGTSSGTEPTSWPATSTQSDGTVVWTRDADDDQLPTGNGYTQNNKALANGSWVENDTDNDSGYTCDDVTWTCATSDWAPVAGHIIYDNTTSDDTIISYTSFNSLNDSITDGSVTASGTVLTSAGSSWTVDDLIGKKLIIGSGSNESTYTISDNDATTITISGDTFAATESSITATIENVITHTITVGNSLQIQDIDLSIT
jgi:hypothetical protein